MNNDKSTTEEESDEKKVKVESESDKLDHHLHRHHQLLLLRRQRRQSSSIWQDQNERISSSSSIIVDNANNNNNNNNNNNDFDDDDDERLDHRSEANLNAEDETLGELYGDSVRFGASYRLTAREAQLCREVDRDIADYRAAHPQRSSSIDEELLAELRPFMPLESPAGENETVVDEIPLSSSSSSSRCGDVTRLLRHRFRHDRFRRLGSSSTISPNNDKLFDTDCNSYNNNYKNTMNMYDVNDTKHAKLIERFRRYYRDHQPQQQQQSEQHSSPES